MYLWFGKHYGKSIHEVPRSYLEWLNRQEWFALEHPDLAWNVRQLLGTSEGKRAHNQSQQTTALVADTFKSWRQKALSKWHPDRPGGSHSAFVAVNDVIDSLSTLLKDKGVLA